MTNPMAEYAVHLTGDPDVDFAALLARSERMERELRMTPPESELSATDVSSKSPSGDDDASGAERSAP